MSDKLRHSGAPPYDDAGYEPERRGLRSGSAQPDPVSGLTDADREYQRGYVDGYAHAAKVERRTSAAQADGYETAYRELKKAAQDAYAAWVTGDDVAGPMNVLNLVVAFGASPEPEALMCILCGVKHAPGHRECLSGDGGSSSPFAEARRTSEVKAEEDVAPWDAPMASFPKLQRRESPRPLMCILCCTVHAPGHIECLSGDGGSLSPAALSVKECASCGATWTEDTLWCSACQKVNQRTEAEAPAPNASPAVCLICATYGDGAVCLGCEMNALYAVVEAARAVRREAPDHRRALRELDAALDALPKHETATDSVSVETKENAK